MLAAIGLFTPMTARDPPASAPIFGRRMGRKRAATHIGAWVKEHVARVDRERFREIVESELLGLHEGNFVRYRVRPSQFAAWREAWKR